MEGVVVVKNDESYGEEKEITAKAFSEQFGIPVRDVLSAINRAKIESKKNREGLFVYDLEEIQNACDEFFEESKRRMIDLELEVLKRFMPEFHKIISEVVKNELSLSISIRDAKEARIIDALASIRSHLIESRTVLGYISKMAAQIDLASTNKLLNTGNEIQNKIQKNTESVERTENKEATTDSRNVKKQDVIKKDAKPGTPQRGRELINAFLVGPRLVESSKVLLTDNIRDFHSVLIAKERNLRDAYNDNRKLINEFLEPYEDIISDCPEVNDFYSMSSRLSNWVSKHSEEAPRIVLFLALNRVNEGLVTAQDYLDFLV